MMQAIRGSRFPSMVAGPSIWTRLSPVAAPRLGIREFGAAGVKKAFQRRRSRGRLIQLKETHYTPKPLDYTPVPISLLGSGPIRRLVNTRTEESHQLMKT